VGVSRDCPNFFGYPIIPGTGNATDFKFCRNIHRLDRKKDHKNVGNSCRGRSQGVPNIQGTHRVHRAVIFATAQLSCSIWEHSSSSCSVLVCKIVLVPVIMHEKSTLFGSRPENRPITE